MILQVVAPAGFGYLHGVLMENVAAARIAGRNGEAGHGSQRGIVAGGHGLAGRGIGRQLAQLHAQQGRLQRVEARVEADALVVVLAALAVVGELLEQRGAVGIAGEQRAAVAEATEVFRGEEGGRAHLAHRAGKGCFAAGKPESGPNGLGVVLNQGHAVAGGDGAQRLQIGTLAKQVHGDNGSGARRNGGLHGGRAKVEGVGPHVGQHGPQAQQGGGFQRGHVGESGNDDFGPGRQVQTHERQRERIGAIGAGNNVRAAQVLAQLGRKLAHLRPLDEGR